MKFLFGFLMMFFSSVVVASDADQVTISEPFARASMHTNSAVFMTVLNKGGDTALVSASSPVAEVVELHTHREENGVMRMRQVEKIDLPGGEVVTLKPGGLHVMLIGLKQGLEVGAEVSVSLMFEDGSEKTLMAPVVNVMRSHNMKQGAGHGDDMGHGEGMAQKHGTGRNQIKSADYQQCEGHAMHQGKGQGMGHGKKYGAGYQHGQGHGKKHGEAYAQGKGQGMKHGKGYEQCEAHSQMSQ